ncbi:nucleotidyltransferase domain-containing protein [Thiomicrorhabdus sp. 6S2-11]|uniref:Nucleotidyltransferase domain-containing protein n=2 Tax=Thiomicrorhabdus marina TaxID=2818442 RepID=A0ABS3Q636_9GAMM|nr:nucleotidyltransferase domain-containing protein [Thiomicrorhabdus marina]
MLMTKPSPEIFGLNRNDLSKIQSVFSAFPQVTKVVIYGSRAKGTFRPASDIDLTIMNTLDWQTFTHLESELDDLLLPYQIDLSIFQQIDNPDLIEHINRVGRDFYLRS